MRKYLVLLFAVVAATGAWAQSAGTTTSPRTIVSLTDNTEVPCVNDPVDAVSCRIVLRAHLVEDTQGRQWCTVDGLPSRVKVQGRKRRAVFRTIVWEVNDSELVAAGYSAAFAPRPAGIFVTRDDFRQFVEGDVGDGDGGQDPKTYFIRTRRNLFNAEIHYFPVIQMTDSRGQISVCAAADPKIVND